MNTDSLRIDYAELLSEARAQILDWLKAVAEPIGNQMYEYTFEDGIIWAGNCNVLSIRADRENVVLFRAIGGHNDFTVFDIGMDGVLGFMEQLEDTEDIHCRRAVDELHRMIKATACNALDFDEPIVISNHGEKVVSVEKDDGTTTGLRVVFDNGKYMDLNQVYYTDWKRIAWHAKEQALKTTPAYSDAYQELVFWGKGGSNAEYAYNLNEHGEFGALAIHLGDTDECPLSVLDVCWEDGEFCVLVSIMGTELMIDCEDTLQLRECDLTEQNLEDIAKFFKSKSDVLPEGYGHDKELVRKINNAYRDHREDFEIIMYALAQKYDEATAETLLLNGFEQKDIAKNATDFLAKICDDTDLQIIIDFCSTIK